MSRPQEDGIIRYGDHISLKHLTTERYLASRGDECYESGSYQQKAFTVAGELTEESTWIVIPPKETEEERGYEVGYEDNFRLKHVPTRSNLHSHGIDSPISGQQEVSCFGNDENSDDNDLWELVQVDEDSDESLWRVGDPVLLRHVETGRFLHSHDIILNDEQNEVTGYHEADENSQWAVSFD